MHYLKSWNLLKAVFKPHILAFPCDTPAAITAPAWTIGPSLPSGKPAEHAKMIPTDNFHGVEWDRSCMDNSFSFTSCTSTWLNHPPITLQVKVLIRTTRDILIPFKKHLISGIPDPPTGEITTWGMYTCLYIDKDIDIDEYICTC